MAIVPSRVDASQAGQFANNPPIPVESATIAPAIAVSLSTNCQTHVAFARYRQLRAFVSAARLDTVITNADILNAITRADRAEAFDASHVFIRRTLWDELRVCPARRIVRRWTTADGRANIRRRLLAVVSRMLDLSAVSPERVKLLTLTYRSSAESWRNLSHIRAFLNNLRHHVRRKGGTLSYMWVAELQKRGAVHYHLVLAGCPFIAKAKLREWWPHGYLDVRAANCEDAASYVLKYCRKSTASDSDGQNVTNLLFAAARKRHWSGSRSVSATPERMPPWYDDIAEASEGSVYILDYAADARTDILWIQLSNGQEFHTEYKEKCWQMILPLNDSSPPT